MIVIVFIVFMIIILALMDLWETILTQLSFLDIRINLGGYLLISFVLFVIWCIVVFFFDKQIYGEFTPGGFSVVDDIGAGVKAFPTFAMTVTKQRSDLFRHMILGFGSGDLIVQPHNAPAIELPNVLFAGRKAHEINQMFKVVAPAQSQ